MSFRFEIPISIYPVADTMHIGDTLWIESTYDRFLLNLENQKRYDVGAVSFHILNYITDLTTNPARGVSNINYVITTGWMDSNPPGFGYVLDGDSLHMKSRLVLDRTGPYMLSFGAFYFRSFKYSGQQITQCPTEYVELTFITNNNADNGFNLFKTSPDTFFNAADKVGYASGGSYSFYVKP